MTAGSKRKRNFDKSQRIRSRIFQASNMKSIWLLHYRADSSFVKWIEQSIETIQLRSNSTIHYQIRRCSSLWVHERICTLKKITVLYLHRWFHDEPLTSTEPFPSTLYIVKKGSLDRNSLHTKKKWCSLKGSSYFQKCMALFLVNFVVWLQNIQ